MNLAELFVRVQADVSGLKRGMADANASMRGMETTSARLGASMTRLGGLFAAAFSARAIVTGLSRANAAADALDASVRELASTAKITGQNLGFLQVTAKNANDQFRIGARLANEFAIEVTKLASKAGQVEQAGAALGAFLDLGAGRGLDAAATLRAVEQAILGIDEGTDKLFGKNPSVLYAEFARTIGKTATSLTDAEKAAAILNAAMVDGGKVAGEYGRFLQSPAGQASLLKIRVEEAAESIGKSMASIRTASYPILTGLAERTVSLIAKFRTLAIDAEELFFKITNADFVNAISRGGRQTERPDFEEYVAKIEEFNQKRQRLLADIDAAVNFDPNQKALQTFLDKTGSTARKATSQVNELADALARLDKRVGFTPRDNSLGDPSIATSPAGGPAIVGGVNLAPVTPRSQKGGIIPERERGLLDSFADNLKEQGRKVAETFGPLAAAAAALRPVFQGIMDTLGPVLSSLAEPLRIVGQLLGATIAPILKLLEPPLRALAIVTSYVIEGLGMLIKAVGDAINALVPFANPANGVVRMGREMIESAKAARRNLNAVNDVTDGMERLASSMTNVPAVFANALRRFQASTVGIGGGGAGSGAQGPKPWERVLPYDGPGGVKVTGNTINVYANDPAEFGRQMEEYGQRISMRGGYSHFSFQGG